MSNLTPTTFRLCVFSSTNRDLPSNLSRGAPTNQSGNSSMPPRASSDEVLVRHFWNTPITVRDSSSQTNNVSLFNVNSVVSTPWETSSHSAPSSPSLYEWVFRRYNNSSPITETISRMFNGIDSFFNFNFFKSNRESNSSESSTSSRFAIGNFLTPESVYNFFSNFETDQSNPSYDNAYWNGNSLVHGENNQLFSIASVAIQGNPEHAAYQATRGNHSAQAENDFLQILNKIEKNTKEALNKDGIVFENLDQALLQIINIDKVDLANLKTALETESWKQLLEIVDSERETEKRFEKGKKLLAILLKIRDYVKVELANSQEGELKTYMNRIEGYWNNAWKLIYYFHGGELYEDPITLDLLEMPFSIPHDSKTRAVFNKLTIASLNNQNPFNQRKFEVKEIRFEAELQLWSKDKAQRG